MTDFFKDRIKEIISLLLSAAIPATALKWTEVIPFINPQIIKDVSTISGIIAVIVAIFVCVYSRSPPPPSSPTASSVVVASLGLLLSIIGLIFMVAISSGLVMSDSSWESFLVHLSYISLVVGAAAPIGWAVGRAF